VKNKFFPHFRLIQRLPESHLSFKMCNLQGQIGRRQGERTSAVFALFGPVEGQNSSKSAPKPPFFGMLPSPAKPVREEAMASKGRGAQPSSDLNSDRAAQHSC
jgi:hypothetical protein